MLLILNIANGSGPILGYWLLNQNLLYCTNNLCKIYWLKGLSAKREGCPIFSTGICQALKFKGKFQRCSLQNGIKWNLSFYQNFHFFEHSLEKIMDCYVELIKWFGALSMTEKISTVTEKHGKFLKVIKILNQN